MTKIWPCISLVGELAEICVAPFPGEVKRKPGKPLLEETINTSPEEKYSLTTTTVSPTLSYVAKEGVEATIYLLRHRGIFCISWWTTGASEMVP